MAWYHSIGSALQALTHTIFGRRQVERELDEEMRFHLDMEAERNRAAGMAPEVARRTAARDFGGVERYKEEVRDERGARWFEDLGQDVHYALRVLRRRAGFTVVAALTLALGIGATTTLFGVVKAVLLTPLPYGRPESVAVVWAAWKGFDQTWLSYDEWEAFTTEIPAFADIALFNDGSISFTDGDEPERVRAGFVTHNTFRTLEARPMIGRTFTPEEDRPNGPRVIVLGHELWQRRYGGDPTVVGRDVQIGGEATTVVGVMPRGFRLPLDFAAAGPSEAWLPLATDAASNSAAPGPAMSPDGMNHGYNSVARLAPGATVEQANAQLRSLVASWVRDGPYPAEMQFRAFTVPVEEQVTGRIRQALLIVFAAVGLVLLIACTNVAGLLLVRGEQRRRELAVRVALGAGTRRLTRQLLTETLVLAGLGGTLGVALAALGVWLVRQNAPSALARVAETRLDPIVLLFAVGVSVVAALLSGVLPALQATRVAPANELKEGGRATTTGIGRLRWRQTLVAAEVALAVVLVVGAGLMIRSVSNLFAIDAGIRPEGVLTMRLTTPSTWYPDSIRVTGFYDELRRRVSAMPGVEAVGAARLLPLATEMGDWGLQIEGYTPPPGDGTPGDWQVATPGYFEAMGLRRIAGRFFEESDAMNAPLVMVINERFA
ncbi:MAG TPA: ABC transporter permease, partial [Gemmatimonadaceae bacterium]|nr:ABC transporter permease [Gemmatimonadaceae bacterium]